MQNIFSIRSLFLASLITFLAAAAFATGKHGHTPKFGGIVVETKVGDLEIVAKPDSILIYATDHGKAMKLDGAKAKVTLLNGTEKSKVELVLVDNKLQAKGAFKVVKGTKGIAVFTLARKAPVTARFTIK